MASYGLEHTGTAERMDPLDYLQSGKMPMFSNKAVGGLVPQLKCRILAWTRLRTVMSPFTIELLARLLTNNSFELVLLAVT